MDSSRIWSTPTTVSLNGSFLRTDAEETLVKPKQKWCLAAGIVAAALVLSFLLSTDHLQRHYYLYRLKSGSPEFLSTLMEQPEGTAARRAVEQFVASAEGRQQLLSLVVEDLDGVLIQPRGGKPGTITLKEYYPHAFIGMRFRAAKGSWVLFADLRRPGTTLRASIAAHDPSFANSEAVAAAFEAMCRAAGPNNEITLRGYPEHRFRVETFEEGLNQYQVMLGAHGQSIENSAYWYESLQDWRDLLESGELKPWVVLAKKVEQ